MPEKTVSKTINKEILGTIFALLAAIISGFAIPINKIFVVDMDPAVFTAIRALIIGAVFLVIAAAQSKFFFSVGDRRFKKVPWSYLLAIGLIGGGLAFLLYFTGLGMTTVGRAAFLQKLLPVFVGVFAFLFLKEKMPKKYLGALLVMIVGVFFVVSARIEPGVFWSNPGFGDILIILATLFWGIEAVLAKKAMIKGETSFVVSFGRMFFGGVFLFGAIVLLGKINVLMALSMQQITNILISTGILFGYVLFFYAAIRYINASKATALLLIAPIISLILGIWWFSEPLPLLQIIGSVLILVGAVVVVKIKSEFSSGV